MNTIANSLTGTVRTASFVALVLLLTVAIVGGELLATPNQGLTGNVNANFGLGSSLRGGGCSGGGTTPTKTPPPKPTTTRPPYRGIAGGTRVLMTGSIIWPHRLGRRYYREVGRYAVWGALDTRTGVVYNAYMRIHWTGFGPLTIQTLGPNNAFRFRRLTNGTLFHGLVQNAVRPNEGVSWSGIAYKPAARSYQSLPYPGRPNVYGKDDSRRWMRHYAGDLFWGNVSFGNTLNFQRPTAVTISAAIRTTYTPQSYNRWQKVRVPQWKPVIVTVDRW